VGAADGQMLQWGLFNGAHVEGFQVLTDVSVWGLHQGTPRQSSEQQARMHGNNRQGVGDPCCVTQPRGLALTDPRRCGDMGERAWHWGGKSVVSSPNPS